MRALLQAKCDTTKTMRAGGKQSAGFTIVETLIVLTVTSLMAVSVILLVNGRQNKTQFQVAANSTKQQLEQIINETSNGYYPRNESFTCNGNGIKPSISTGITAQGTNSGCIFLGKAVAFGVGSTAVDPEAFIVYPLVAKRFAQSTTKEVTSFAEAAPIALAPGDDLVNPAAIDYSVKAKLQNGLSLYQARYTLADGSTSGQKNYAVFALADQLGDYTPGTDGTLSSATQKLNLFDYDLDAMSWPGTPTSSSGVVANINKGIDDTRTITLLELCFESGGTDQSAKVSVTGKGQLAVTLKIFGGKKCDF